MAAVSVKEPTLTPTERRLSRTFKKNDSINRDALQALLRHPGFAPASKEEAAFQSSLGFHTEIATSASTPAEKPAATRQAKPSAAAVALSAAASAPPPASSAPPLKPAVVPIPSVSTGSSSSLSIHSSSSIVSPPAAQPSVASPPQIATKKGSTKGSRLVAVPLDKPLATQLSPRAELSRSASSGEHLALRRSAPELAGCVVPPNAPPAIIEHASRLPRRNPSPAQKRMRSGTFSFGQGPPPVQPAAQLPVHTSLTPRSSSLIPRDSRRKRTDMAEAIELLSLPGRAKALTPRANAAAAVNSPAPGAALPVSPPPAAVDAARSKEKEKERLEKKERKRVRKEAREEKRKHKEEKKRHKEAMQVAATAAAVEASHAAKGEASIAAKAEASKAAVQPQAVAAPEPRDQEMREQPKDKKAKKEKKEKKEKKDKKPKHGAEPANAVAPPPQAVADKPVATVAVLPVAAAHSQASAPVASPPARATTASPLASPKKAAKDAPLSPKRAATQAAIASPSPAPPLKLKPEPAPAQRMSSPSAPRLATPKRDVPALASPARHTSAHQASPKEAARVQPSPKAPPARMTSPKSAVALSPGRAHAAKSESAPRLATPKKDAVSHGSPAPLDDAGEVMPPTRPRRTPSDLSARRRHRRKAQDALRHAEKQSRAKSLSPPSHHDHMSPTNHASPQRARSGPVSPASPPAKPTRAASSPVPRPSPSTPFSLPSQARLKHASTDYTRAPARAARDKPAGSPSGSPLEAEGLAPRRGLGQRPKSAYSVVPLKTEPAARPVPHLKEKDRERSRVRSPNSPPQAADRRSVHTLIDIAKLKITSL